MIYLLPLLVGIAIGYLLFLLGKRLGEISRRRDAERIVRESSYAPVVSKAFGMAVYEYFVTLQALGSDSSYAIHEDKFIAASRKLLAHVDGEGEK